MAEMADYVSRIEELHNADADSETSHSHICGLPYDEKNCILGATDIVLDQVMYSVAIQPLYEELTKNGETQEEAAERLYQSLAAMDGMVHLFYQHKD